MEGLTEQKKPGSAVQVEMPWEDFEDGGGYDESSLIRGNRRHSRSYRERLSRIVRLRVLQKGTRPSPGGMTLDKIEITAALSYLLPRYRGISIT